MRILFGGGGEPMTYYGYEKVQEMKREAAINNDAFVFNSINNFEQTGNDVSVLVRAIAILAEENRKLNKIIYG